MPKGTDCRARASQLTEVERENIQLRECIEAMAIEYEAVAAKLAAVHAISAGG